MIGGSIAIDARRKLADVRIAIVDSDPTVVDKALRRNYADQAGADLSLVAGSDLVVLAAPVRQNIQLLNALPEHVEGDLLVTDVGSTKAAIVAAARALPPRIRFVGGHPMAGSEAGGIDAALKDLFQGRSWFLTPPGDEDPARARPEDLELIEHLVTSFDGVPYRLSPADHDRLMAYVSHLPQLTVSALMDVIGTRVRHDGLALAGNGLRGSTRLASSPSGIWRDIASSNAAALEVALDDLIRSLQRLRDDLARGDELTKVFDSAQEWKGYLG